MPTRNILALIGLAMLCCSGLAPRAHAEPVFVVNSTLDQVDADTSDGVCATAAGACTLRAAIMQANRMSGAGVTIQLPAGTYTLVRPRTTAGGDMDGDLDLTAGSPSIHIVGSGRDTTIIDANQIDRLFTVEARIVTISKLTLRNGYGNGGGALYNRGTLTLDGVTIGDSTSHSDGGAILNSTGAKLVLNDVVIRNAEAIGDGGGIYNGGHLTLDKSQVSNSVAGGNGGGVFIPQNSKLTVRYSVLSGNSAKSGGAIYSQAWFHVLASTISGNVAHREGGGIAAMFTTDAGVQLIEDSAIIGNYGRFWGGGVLIDRQINMSMRIVSSTIANNDVYGDGGGIANHGTLDVYNSTIAFNMADVESIYGGRGGGIYVSGYRTNLRNTLVASNWRGGAPMPDDCTVQTYDSGASDEVHSYGRNLFGDVEGCKIVTKTGSWGMLSPGSLGTFGNNGGPTTTVALRAGSNAIDAGTLDGGCRDHRGALSLDQRGFPRVGACDIGAFEFGATDPDLIFRHGFES